MSTRLDSIVGSIVVMPFMLCMIVLLKLVVWPGLASAQTHEQSASIDHRHGTVFRVDWISTWVEANVVTDGYAYDLAAPSIATAGVTEVDRRTGRGIKLDDAKQSHDQKSPLPQKILRPEQTPKRDVSDLVDRNEALLQQLEATRKVLAIFDEQAAEALQKNETLVAEAEQNRQRIAALERELSAAVEKINRSHRDNDRLLAKVERLQQDRRQEIAALNNKDTIPEGDRSQYILPAKKPAAETRPLRSRTEWIAQLVGVHRASRDGAHEIDKSSGQEQDREALINRFQKTFGQDFALPDLEAFGAFLVGGQIYKINGTETGRIAYRDADNNTLDFWLVPSPGRNSRVSFGEQNDLNFVYWNQNGVEYALVSSLAWSNLAPIAGELHQRYRW